MATKAEKIEEAKQLGASEKTVKRLENADLISRVSGIILDAIHLEFLSRGRGWCRKSDGTFSNERSSCNGYIVREPGEWTVGATDGFSRTRRATYKVELINIIDDVWWFIAS